MKFLQLLFIVCTGGLLAQQPAKQFPRDWEGIWKGYLNIHSAQGLLTQMPMELHILPKDSVRWTWKIVYAPKNKDKDIRNYELIIKDKKNNHYAIDEKDGIVLDAFFTGGTFISKFEVQGAMITSMEHFEGEDLVMELIASDSKAINHTGGKGDEIPPVSSYRINSYHKAKLKKSK